MPYRTLTLETDAEIATLTFNRPDKRNSLTTEMIEEIGSALDESASGPARVLIMTGLGQSFCSGMDIGELRALTEQSFEQSVEDSRRMAKLFRQLYVFPKPLIAAVNGAAVAGGCGIATLADFTIAVPEAKFGYTEARIGFIPAIVSVFLVRQIGEKRARDLLLSARLVGAEEAQWIGLVSEVVPAEMLRSRARELANQLLALSPTSLVFTKRLLREYSEADLDRDIELAVRENADIRATADFREGVTAFLEKRKPAWRGQ